jgi:IS605 OrfB family transposase
MPQPKSKAQTFTYQTRLELLKEHQAVLCSYAELMSKTERTLFADISKGKTSAELKSSYLKKFNITARQFNSIRIQVEGKIDSIKELRKEGIKDLKERIVSLEKKITSLTKRKEKNLFIIHQKKRRLFLMESKLKNLKDDESTGKISLCFGSRKLFRAQFNLEDNGFQTHEEWHQAWTKTRNASFFLVGSKDESGGNQSCTTTIQEDGSFTLRLRLPDALANNGVYINIPNVKFQYGHDKLLASLKNGAAISYRFKKDEKGWRCFASTTLEEPKTLTREEIGLIGVDINADHLAVVETDRMGNPIAHRILSFDLYGKDSNQTRAIIGDAAAQIIRLGVETEKPIVLESLSFQKKKTQLRENSHAKMARTLSSFAYSAIINIIKARAYRTGVKIKEVNPAYTSIIGRVKFAKRYGLSIHRSAALCIARRSLGFSEKLPRHLNTIPDGKGGHVALPLPVRNRGEHVWKPWRYVHRKLPAALAAHFQAIKNRSSGRPPPACAT